MIPVKMGKVILELLIDLKNEKDYVILFRVQTNINRSRKKLVNVAEAKHQKASPIDMLEKYEVQRLVHMSTNKQDPVRERDIISV